MIKDWFKSSKIEQPHPSEEDLLRCVDGELSTREAARVRTHLETCWNCRVQLEKLEETISAFVEFRQQIQIPLTEKPPKNWNDFDKKLEQLILEMPAKKFQLVNLGWFDRFNRNIIRFSEWTPIWKQTAISTVALLLIFTVFWQFVFVSTVSANELLNKATQFQNQQIKEVNQAVVYQKLRVQRQDSAQMDWEVWRDTTRSRFRQNVSLETSSSINNDLWKVLQDNGFNPQEPLSAVTFAKWRESLKQKTDSVEEEQSGDGSNILALKTVNLQADSVGKIVAGTLKVKAEDFHPVEQTLQITTGNGVEVYSFKELDFKVVSLSSLKPDFFAESVEIQPTIAKIKPSPFPKPEESITPSIEPGLTAENNNATSSPETVVPKIKANADLEIEVMDLLNQAKADLGEQITVQRKSDGLLNVRGIVETPTRKNEILQYLQSIRNNPAVRIEIKTVNEAVAEQKKTPTPSGTVEKIESGSSETAADSELLTYFKSEQAARVFGGQMISRSSRAMRRAYALKRLVGQFKPEELRQLSPESKMKLLNLVSSHASAFREETAGLRQELQPVFNGLNVGASNTLVVNDVTDLPKAVALLLDFASANDQGVRSAFTISSGEARFTTVKTTQFWQSLRNAEALAAKLQSVK